MSVKEIMLNFESANMEPWVLENHQYRKTLQKALSPPFQLDENGDFFGLNVKIPWSDEFINNDPP
jgi:hypothetical protein